MKTSTQKLHLSDLKILVVDDDDDLRFLMAKILRDEGYSVSEAASAREADEVALSQTPDLVLMDIGMPEEDGLSALWRIREHPELAQVPVVIVSAYDSYDLRAEAAAEGCKAYLTKPLDPDSLTSVVGEILGS
jgi:two-component system, cell cycle response regulator DivK